MAELLLELFSEEIPARMQARAAEDLARLVETALAPLSPTDLRAFAGPRRIALVAQVAGATPASHVRERGPRRTAPEAALAGFLRKHKAARDDLREDGDFWVLETARPAIAAIEMIAEAMPALIRRFPWPKSMRWGESALTWVRPLRRILCILDGVVVPFDLADTTDDAHGLSSTDKTEGHRFHAPGTFAIRSAAEWQAGLRQHKVIADAAERRTLVESGLRAAAATHGLTLVDDPALMNEVTGLVEWPVPLIGRIDDAYMDLPAEVMQVSMRVNQRYFATRTADDAPAPFFAFAANIDATDGGTAIIAGNERVLRARFADARHFWDLDRKTRLADRVPALDAVTFHAKLGSQGDRVKRITALAERIAPWVNADAGLARRAATLAKADLTTGMVGEFPELQGVMGGYYARHDGEDPRVADAVRDHYLPKGPGDTIPTEMVSVAVALADKLSTLTSFFTIGEKPTGSGDPYALRRAALGVIRLIRENGLRLRLRDLMRDPGSSDSLASEVMAFLGERLRVQLRAEGARHDVLAAVVAAGDDDDLVLLLARTDAVATLLGSEDGANLLAAYKRAANILRIEEQRETMRFDQPVDRTALQQPEETALADALDAARPAIAARIAAEDFAGAMAAMAGLRAPLDRFFDKVTVNATDPLLRLNRLRLLNTLRTMLDSVADFSRIEGGTST